MRITIPSWRAPTCKCGSKMEIYVDLCSQRLRVKCLYCGFEQSNFMATGIATLPLCAIADTARLLVETE